MGNKVYYERYTNIYRFMDTIESRPNNEKFGRDSGFRGEWYGTETWEIAMEQFSNGIPETAEKLKKSLSAFKANTNVSATKSRPINYYYGHTPNIPAAIIGLPKSMRKIERTPQNIKAITIYYDMGNNCGTSAETLRKSGETVLQLIYALECRGYRVAFEGIVFNAESSGRDFILSVRLKEYKDHLDILKLSFPITSPAMFRRFGFKWAETLPGVEGGHVVGYGSHKSKASVLKSLNSIGIDTKSVYFINTNDCENNDFDALKVAKEVGIIM